MVPCLTIKRRSLWVHNCRCLAEESYTSSVVDTKNQYVNSALHSLPLFRKENDRKIFRYPPPHPFQTIEKIHWSILKLLHRKPLTHIRTAAFITYFQTFMFPVFSRHGAKQKRTDCKWNYIDIFHFFSLVKGIRDFLKKAYAVVEGGIGGGGGVGGVSF